MNLPVTAAFRAAYVNASEIAAAGAVSRKVNNHRFRITARYAVFKQVVIGSNHLL